MPDVFDKAKRRQIMKSIQSKNTKAELVVFRYLKRRGIYFQRHYKRALGSPNIALPRKKKAVFIDSDFWHGKTIERIKQDRDPNDYWVKKITRNMERDIQVRSELRGRGWQVLIA